MKKLIYLIALTYINTLSAQVGLFSGEAALITCAPCQAGATTNPIDFLLAENEQVVVSCGLCPMEEPSGEPPETSWIPYNDFINPNSMEWNGHEWRIDIETDGTIWWGSQRGEALRMSEKIFPGDTITIPNVFVECPFSPWRYCLSMVNVMENENNWEFASIGNRPTTYSVHPTIEHKRTLNDISRQADIGNELSIVDGRVDVDIRITVLGDGSIYWEYDLGSGFIYLDPVGNWYGRIDCLGGCDLLIGGYSYGTVVPFTAGAGEPFYGE